MKARKVGAYESGKWSINEVLLHIIDAERVFVYRALCIARNEKQALPGFDQNDYVTGSRANDYSIAQLVENYNALRTSTEVFFQQLSSQDLKKMGTASDKTVSVRALAYILAGHEQHHLKVLKNRYQLNLSI